jgi:hypothetical protein
MKTLSGLQWHQRYNEHMGCVKGCLDFLGADISFPWLYGGTGQAFALNMNDTTFVDAELAWDTQSRFEQAPNLGFTRAGFTHDPGRGEETSSELFLEAQRKAWDFVRVAIDRGIPCYGWELSHIPSYYVINGYDGVGYYYSGWESGGPCPWDRIGTFDVRVVAVHSIELCNPAPDAVTVREALGYVLSRVERPDGWALGSRYRTGLAGYEMWAGALESGGAIYDGHAYLTPVWLECREMAVEFLEEARTRLPGRCDEAFGEAIAHYGVVRDRLRALAELHQERPEEWDWTTTFASSEGAQLVREAAQAERQGVACLQQIAGAL